MNGYQTVVYTRDRTTGTSSDFGRTERQRKVLTAIFEKAKNDYEETSSSSTVQKLLSYMTNDLTGGDTLKLMAKMSEWLNYQLEEQRIPFDDSYYITEDQILVPNNMDETIAKLQEILYD